MSLLQSYPQQKVLTQTLFLRVACGGPYHSTHEEKREKREEEGLNGER